MVEVRQREVWWAELPEPAGSGPGLRRPVVVVQGNPLNRSRIATVVCVPLTSNLVCIGRLGLLPALFGVITIPDAVFHEIAVANPDAPGASDVRTASWVRRYAVVNRPLVTRPV